MVAEEMVVSAAAAKVMMTITAEVEVTKMENGFPLEAKLLNKSNDAKSIVNSQQVNRQ